MDTPNRTVAERVAKAVRVLDASQPGWWAASRIASRIPQAYEPFTGDDVGAKAAHDAEYEALAAEWRRVISERRASTTDADS